MNIDFGEKENITQNNANTIYHTPQPISTSNFNQHFVTNLNLGRQKKNRTFQFYKFLYYSVKTEILANDFTNLIRASNLCELLLWILSLVLYCNTPKDYPKVEPGQKKIKYKNIFIWLHLFHVIRSCLGYYIWYKLPKSFEVLKSFQSTDKESLEKKFFNDIIRDTAKNKIFNIFASLKWYFTAYFALALINFLIDIIDLFTIIFTLNKASSDSKVVLLVYLIISFFYCYIDVAYFEWGALIAQLYPREYIEPIYSVMRGKAQSILKSLKIGKPQTDINQENQPEKENKLPELNDQIHYNKKSSQDLVEQYPEKNSNAHVNQDDIHIDL